MHDWKRDNLTPFFLIFYFPLWFYGRCNWTNFHSFMSMKWVGKVGSWWIFFVDPDREMWVTIPWLNCGMVTASYLGDKWIILKDLVDFKWIQHKICLAHVEIIPINKITYNEQMILSNKVNKYNVYKCTMERKRLFTDW